LVKIEPVPVTSTLLLLAVLVKPMWKVLLTVAVLATRPPSETIRRFPLPA
jgi:hypothetical protein